jgi:hypothetical protein
MMRYNKKSNAKMLNVYADLGSGLDTELFVGKLVT